MKCRLFRIYLNSGGYDSNGNYFGLGQKLYGYELDANGNNFAGGVRATDRDDAKRQVVTMWPQAKFYR